MDRLESECAHRWPCVPPPTRRTDSLGERYGKYGIFFVRNCGRKCAFGAIICLVAIYCVNSARKFTK